MKMKRKMTPEEISFVMKIIGGRYKNREINFSKISIEETGKYKTSFSLPGGTIVTEDVPTMTSIRNKSILVHEVFHQFQYQAEGIIAVQKLWLSIERLIGNRAYQYEIGSVSVLDDIKKYEARAQFIEDFTFRYLQFEEAFKVNNVPLMQDVRRDLNSYAKILLRSDIISEIIQKFAE